MKVVARSALRPVLLAAIAYVVIGVVTAHFAAASAQIRTGWRLAAWLLSLVTFASHVAYERLRIHDTATRAARHAAAAVALAAFVLAAAGPVRTHWAAVDFWRATLLSLVLWPVLTGSGAFLAALVLGSIWGGFTRRPRAP